MENNKPTIEARPKPVPRLRTSKKPNAPDVTDGMLVPQPPPPLSSSSQPVSTPKSDHHKSQNQDHQPQQQRPILKPLSRRSSFTEEKGVTLTSNSCGNPEHNQFKNSMEQYRMEVDQLNNQIQMLQDSTMKAQEKALKQKVEYKARIENLQGKLRLAENRVTEIQLNYQNEGQSENEELVRMKHKCKELEVAQRRLEMKVKTSDEQRASVETTLHDMLVEMDDKDRMFESVKEEKNQMMMELKKLREDYASKKAEYENSISRVRDSVGEHRRSLSADAADAGELEALKSELNSIKEKYQQLLLESSQLKGEIAAKEDLFGRSTSHVKEIEARYAEATILNEQLTNEIDSMSMQLESLQSVREENLNLKSVLTRMEKSLTEVSKIRDELQNRVEQLECETEEWKNRALECSEELEKLQGRLDRSVSEENVESIRQALQNAKSEVEKLEGELQTMNKQHRSDREEHELKIVSLQQELEESRKSEKALDENFRSVQDSQALRIRDLTAQHEDDLMMIEEMGKSLDELSLQIGDYEDQLKRLKGENEQLKTEENQVQGYKVQLDQMKQTLVDSQTKHDTRELELLGQIKDLQQSTAEKRAIESDQMKQELKNARDEVMQLNEDLRKRTRDVETLQMAANSARGFKQQLELVNEELVQATNDFARREHELQSEIKSLKVQVEERKNSIAVAEESTRSVTMERRQSAKGLSDLLQETKRRVSDQENEINSLRMELASHKDAERNVIDLTHQVSKLKEENDRLTTVENQAKGFEFQAVNLQRRMLEKESKWSDKEQELIRQVADLKGTIEAAKIAKQSSDNSLSKAYAEIDKLKASLKSMQPRRPSASEESRSLSRSSSREVEDDEEKVELREMIQTLRAAAADDEQEMESLLIRIDELESDADRHEPQLDALRKVKFGLEQKVEALQEQITQLVSTKVDAKVQERISDHDELSHLEEQLKVSKERALELEGELGKLRQEREKILGKSQDLKELHQELELLHKEFKKTKDSKQELELTVSDLKRKNLDLAKKAADSDMLEREARELRSRLKQENKSVSLQASDDITTTATMTAPSVLGEAAGRKSLQDEMKDLMSQLEEFKQENQQLKEKIDSASGSEDDERQLKDELVQVKDERDNYKTKLENLNVTFEKLTEQYEDLKNRFDESLSAVNDNDTQELQEQLAALEAKNRQLVFESLENVTDLQRKSSDLLTLEQKVDELQSVLGDKEQEIVQLKEQSATFESTSSELDQQKKSVAEKSEIIKSLEEKCANYERDIQVLQSVRDEIGKLKDQMHQKEVQAEEKARRLSISKNEKDAELARARMSLDKKALQISHLEDQLRQRESECQRLGVEHSDLSEQVAQLQAQVDDLSKKLEAKSFELEKMRDKVANFENEKKRLEESMMQELLDLSMKASEARAELESKLRDKDRKIKELMSQ